MTSIGVRLSTFWSLGLANLARVAFYRIAIRLGVHPVQRLDLTAPKGPFFRRSSSSPPAGVIARNDWKENGLWFGAHAFDANDPPDWHINPFSGVKADHLSNWYELEDFDPELGDIKTVWEASRFDWLLAMAERAALGDTHELDRLNRWLMDWIEKNPPYRGANWKCGQEASIRVLHLALTAIFLDQVVSATKDLRALVKLHLARIAPTLGYAIGQQNNHGTSEAAALFIGGSWLALAGDSDGAAWARKGRKWLEERARSLIAGDGTFSQYSTVYHRLMLDAYAFAEAWRTRFALPAFQSEFYERLSAATRWLHQMVESVSGDVPNLGANDGARILAITDTDYRDFRPSLQWASALFLKRRAIADTGLWDQPLHWLGLKLPEATLPKANNATFDDGGIHVLRADKAVAYLRYPRFDFRPSQSDLLHLDLWVRGENLLRDGGSFSYNGSKQDVDYYSGVASHNTAEIDGRDQMPRLGRFLFGAWPKAEDVAPVANRREVIHAAAGFSDQYGVRHLRTVDLDEKRLVCTDDLDGPAKQAIIRWRLKPGNWRIEGRTIYGGGYKLKVESDVRTMTLRLLDHSESRYYLKKESIPVVEIFVPVPSTLQTSIEF